MPEANILCLGIVLFDLTIDLLHPCFISNCERNTVVDVYSWSVRYFKRRV